MIVIETIGLEESKACVSRFMKHLFYKLNCQRGSLIPKSPHYGPGAYMCVCISMYKQISSIGVYYSSHGLFFSLGISYFWL